MKYLILILAAISLLSFETQASSSRSLSTDCDTLITSTGEMMLVKIEHRTDAIIRYRNCGESEGAIVEQPLSFIKEVRMSRSSLNLPTDAQKIDAHAERNKLELLTTASVACLIGMFVLLLMGFSISIFYFWGVLLFALGGFFSARWVRRHTRKKPQHKQLKTIADVSFILDIAASIVLFLVIFATQFYSED